MASCCSWKPGLPGAGEKSIKGRSTLSKGLGLGKPAEDARGKGFSEELVLEPHSRRCTALAGQREQHGQRPRGVAWQGLLQEERTGQCARGAGLRGCWELQVGVRSTGALDGNSGGLDFSLRAWGSPLRRKLGNTDPPRALLTALRPKTCISEKETARRWRC